MANNEQEMKDAFRTFIKSFQFLTDEETETIVQHSRLQFFKKGTVLLREGEVAQNCYAVINGCVREYYLDDGMERTTSFFTEGQPVASFTSYINKRPSRYNLVCAEDCVLTVGTKSLEDQMCEMIPRLKDFIREEVEKNAGQLQDRLADFVSSTPEERLRKLLKENPGLLARVPQHQIASYLGITPESFSRIKKRMYESRKIK